MKNRKRLEMLLAVIETTALAGVLILSFYLLYGYLQEGERAVSGRAVRTETDGESEEEQALETGKIPNDVEGQDSYELPVTTTETSEISIRVRILDDSYSDDLFEEITVCASDGLLAEYGTYLEDGTFLNVSGKKMAEAVEADQIYVISANELSSGDALRLTSLGEGALTVTSLSRADGTPEYGGELYIYRLENGLALVNELPLEEYLYSVVSSEMPSYYPEEAQKAQAVCARTYALQCIEEGVNGENTTGDTVMETESEKKLADLNDSTAFQVYNNRKSTEMSVNAVNATCGEVLLTDKAQYYSTSALSEHRDNLNEEEAFREFLKEEPKEGTEYDSPWLRWQAEIPITQILKNLEDMYTVQWEKAGNGGENAENMAVEIEVTVRSGNGQAQTLTVTVEGETFEIEGEYSIRQILAPGDAVVTLMDGTTVSGMQLLPSAFFYLDRGKATAEEPDTTEIRTISIYGGGYGHGNGMSQCGAAQMAEDGAAYLDILEYYYGNTG